MCILLSIWSIFISNWNPKTMIQTCIVRFSISVWALICDKGLTCLELCDRESLPIINSSVGSTFKSISPIALRPPELDGTLKSISPSTLRPPQIVLARTAYQFESNTYHIISQPESIKVQPANLTSQILPWPRSWEVTVLATTGDKDLADGDNDLSSVADGNIPRLIEGDLTTGDRCILGDRNILLSGDLKIGMFAQGDFLFAELVEAAGSPGSICILLCPPGSWTSSPPCAALGCGPCRSINWTMSWKCIATCIRKFRWTANSNTNMQQLESGQLRMHKTLWSN